MDLKVAKRFMDELLVSLHKKGGSDLFIIAGAPPSMRIHGKVTPVMEKKLTAEHTLALTQCLMTDAERADFKKTKECNFAIALPKISRFRVNALVQRGSAGLVVRIIPNEIPSFADLHMPDILTQVAMSKRGLVIFVGGTGSGKSTSLAAMIDYRNENSNGHIITIEDPVEFVHHHKGCIVTQREVGTDTESFEIALKNTLRQAPDVILIGEIRDQKTMEHAIAFAETGHLCLATLHANNTNQALDRIINFFPETRHKQLLLDLSLNVKAFISQRLLPTPSGKGRRAAVEVLLNTPLMSDMIMKGEVHEIKGLMKKSKDQGMQTFDQALFDLLGKNAITIEEAMRNADSVNDLRLRIKLAGGGSSEVDDMISNSMSLEDDGMDDASGGGARKTG
ncbi:PilT/PilU family type 4a pilus ATPase [Granulosicoccus antarcticus]|uniref:Twitching mobility protein n=1 Tax=Granulosicoccus antarcticus IMCC3135 TaxID=1192854 RepID=A0A2Z2NIW5_9GAMM|nr:PilT/PilU family type 4a pilus ATPase [Granulosicoccus antarcticus]ASJ71286.1 Twitching mobility protein [Granulosicoccus antarcticus IMCC3135]